MESWTLILTITSPGTAAGTTSAVAIEYVPGFNSFEDCYIAGKEWHHAVAQDHVLNTAVCVKTTD